VRSFCWEKILGPKHQYGASLENYASLLWTVDRSEEAEPLGSS
jgi:hypothetical protein